MISTETHINQTVVSDYIHLLSKIQINGLKFIDKDHLGLDQTEWLKFKEDLRESEITEVIFPCVLSAHEDFSSSRDTDFIVDQITPSHIRKITFDNNASSFKHRLYERRLLDLFQSLRESHSLFSSKYISPIDFPEE